MDRVGAQPEPALAGVAACESQADKAAAKTAAAPVTAKKAAPAKKAAAPAKKTKK